MDDTGAILTRATDAGVSRCVVVGTDEESSRAAVALANSGHELGSSPTDMRETVLWATVGLHPHDAKTSLEPIRTYIDELASSMADRISASTGSAYCGSSPTKSGPTTWYAWSATATERRS